LVEVGKAWTLPRTVLSATALSALAKEPSADRGANHAERGMTCGLIRAVLTACAIALMLPAAALMLLSPT
jgi:hypothetical protein